MRKSLLRNNNGYALAYTLIVVLILGMLSAAILSAVSSNVKTSVREREMQSSYYIAEAGLQYATEQLKYDIKNFYSETSSEEEFFNSLESTYCVNPITVDSSFFEMQFSASPEAKFILQRADMSETNPRTYVVISKGTVGEATRTVMQSFTVSWKIGLGDLYAVYSKNNMELENGTIEGPIATDGDIIVTGDPKIEDYYLLSTKKITAPKTWMNSGKVGTRRVLSSEKNYQLPPFPDFPDEADCVKEPSVYRSNADPPYTINLTSALTYIHEISVDNDTKVIIKLNGMNHKLLVDDIRVPQGIIELEGDGALTVYVRGNISMGGGSIINPPASDEANGNQNNNNKNKGNNKNKKGKGNNKNDNSENNKDIEAVERLTFYIKGTDDPNTNKTISIGGAQKIYGSVYAEDADINITAGSGFLGNILTGGKKVTFSGGTSTVTQMVFAPEAYVSMEGSATVYGPIVANAFKMVGGAKVVYDPDDPDFEIPDDPFFDGGTPKGLIQPVSSIREK